MEHIVQSKRNNCCQTCVQMLTGQSLDTVQSAIGKKGLTRFKDLKRGLEALGRTCGTRVMMYPSLWESIRQHQVCHQDLLCLVTYKNKRKHWVVLSGEYFHDPAMSNKMRIRSYMKRLEKLDAKIHSYMVVLPFAEKAYL